MPELRKDPVTQRWVIIAKERARRPGNIIRRDENLADDSPQDCRFCRPQEEIIRDGKVKVVPYTNSFLSINRKPLHKGKGLYDVVNGFGKHEVVIETSEHIANMADLPQDQIQAVIEMYRERMYELEKMKCFQYIVTYKNFGGIAGSRNIAHARSHIIATPVMPHRAQEMVDGSKNYYFDHHSCVYCDLIRQEKEEMKRVVFETTHFVCMVPFASRFLFDFVIVPKDHHCDFTGNIYGKEGDLAYMLKTMLLKLKHGLGNPAYNYVIHTAPLRHRREGRKWQTIEQDYHWHIELTPRLTQLAGFEKGTGFYINSIPPEQAVEFLKGVDIND